MAQLVAVAGTATKGSDIPIAEITGCAAADFTEVKQRKQVSYPGSASSLPAYSDHAITTLTPAAVQYRIVFTCRNGQKTRYWEFATSAARDAALTAILVILRA
jgi:hypothetical protein